MRCCLILSRQRTSRHILNQGYRNKKKIGTLGKQNKSRKFKSFTAGVKSKKHIRMRSRKSPRASPLNLPAWAPVQKISHLIHELLRPLQQPPARSHESESVLLRGRRLVQGVFAIVRRRRRRRRVGALPSGIADSAVINLAPVLRSAVRVRSRRRRKRMLLRVPLPPWYSRAAPVAVRGRGGRGGGGGVCRRGRRPWKVAPRVRSWGGKA